MNIKKFGIAAATVAAFAMSVTATSPKADIVDTAVAAGSFKTLVSLVQKAELVQTLKGKGPFTVFAPTDAAFAKVPKATLDSLGKNTDALRGVLTYHVVAGNVMAKDVVKLNGKKAKTVNGAEVKVTVRNGQVFLNDKIRVIRTDISATNGVIHVIDGVLLPPATRASTAPVGAKAKGGDCSGCSGK